jgi:hypothetical protein
MVKLTNKRGLPNSIVSAISSYTSLYSRGDADISVTQLIDSPKIKILKEQFNDQIEEDISEIIWRVFGNAVHKLFEDSKSDNDKKVLNEQRFYGKCNGWKISGAIDRLEYETETNGAAWEGDQVILSVKKATIYDYKCVSVWQIFKNSYYPKGFKDEWEEQLNCYAWLLRQNGYVIERGKIRILGLARDWKKSQAWNEEARLGDGYDPHVDYPDVQIKQILIPVWSNEKQDEFIKNRVETHQQADQLYHTMKYETPCSYKEMWKDPTKFAVMQGSKKRALKIFDDKNDAQDYAKNFENTRIQIRPSVSKRCKDYCNVVNFCEQGKKERNAV